MYRRWRGGLDIIRLQMNAQSIPLGLRLTGTLTPVNLRSESTLARLRRSSVDPTTLPFRRELLEWLRSQHTAGRRLVLLVDDESAIAQQVAAELNLFDEVVNIAGPGSQAERTQRALVERFGEHGFDYVGSEISDLPVWRASRGAVVVGDRALAGRVSGASSVLQTLPAAKPTVRTWLKAIRLHQWVKNALVIVPPLLAHRINEPEVLLTALLAFIAFGCCASSVYVVNDLFDLTADRQHPRKRTRPFASGLLTVRSGIVASLLLISCAALLAAYIGMPYVLVLGTYYIVTWAYSLRLKRVALLDVMTLAGLYTLRIIAGAAATGVELSFWLLALSVFLFLSLGFVKRYTEIYDARKAGEMGAHARGYGVDDLSAVISLGTSSGYSAVVVIALYINSTESTALYHHHKTLWLVCPLMLFWISRVWLLTARGHMHDDPVVFALRDRVSLLIVVALAIIVFQAI
jgi:4-hydroxybenzoate polyprenyltransferase